MRAAWDPYYTIRVSRDVALGMKAASIPLIKSCPVPRPLPCEPELSDGLNRVARLESLPDGPSLPSWTDAVCLSSLVALTLKLRDESTARVIDGSLEPIELRIPSVWHPLRRGAQSAARGAAEQQPARRYSDRHGEPRRAPEEVCAGLAASAAKARPLPDARECPRAQRVRRRGAARRSCDGRREAA